MFTQKTQFESHILKFKRPIISEYLNSETSDYLKEFLKACICLDKTKVAFTSKKSAKADGSRTKCIVFALDSIVFFPFIHSEACFHLLYSTILFYKNRFKFYSEKRDTAC